MYIKAVLHIVSIVALLLSVISFIDGCILHVKKYRKQNVIISFAYSILLFGTFIMCQFYYFYIDDIKAFFDRLAANGQESYVVCKAVIVNLMLFFVVVGCFITVSFVVYMILSVLACLKPKNCDGDFILIHGCHTGTIISPILKHRVDKALEVFKNGGEKAMFVLSGGKGSDEPVSEACAMHDYLIMNGVQQKKMFLEDESTTTFENIKIVHEMTSPSNRDPLYIIVSDDYHVLRASIYARKLDMRVKTIGAKTKIYYWFYGTIREFLAVLRDNKEFFIIEIISVFLLAEFYLR